jgi:uncharacterized RDD family membrane protein YckC
MKYAGFWIRAWAVVIDTALFAAPTVLLTYWVYPENSLARAWTLGVEYTLMCVYQIYFQANSGQTLGKYVAGIRVVAMDGSALGYQKSLVRNLWYVIACISGVAEIIALVRVPAADFAQSSWHAQAQLLMASRPSWWLKVAMLVTVWYVIEVVFLLRSKQKRAVHDLMAGTVVTYAGRIMQAGVSEKAGPAA